MERVCEYGNDANLPKLPKAPAAGHADGVVSGVSDEIRPAHG
jgi:hypothetical protein